MENNQEVTKVSEAGSKMETITKIDLNYSILSSFLNGVFFTLGSLAVFLIIGIILFFLGLNILGTIAKSNNSASYNQPQNLGY